MLRIISYHAIVVDPSKEYSLYEGFIHLAAGLACGMTGLAAGYAIGIVGDSVGNRFLFLREVVFYRGDYCSAYEPIYMNQKYSWRWC